MDLRSRVGLAFVLLGCFLGGMVAVDTFGGSFFPVNVTALTVSGVTDQVVTKAGFQYGPQSWRPGYDPLGIFPGKEVLDNETWYLMFIDLNATPVSGDPNVRKIGSVRITYNFTDLAGRTAFHVYGLTAGTIPTRTNRQTGYGNCGYIVTGNATAGSSMPAATPLTIPGSHLYRIAISNNQLADSDDMAVTTRTFSFYPPAGSGQGALHITPGLSKPRGGVTETTDLNGSFYVTATGNDPGSDLILLVAADRPQPDGFLLRVRTEFVRSA
ncbi:MAG: hypothetical protein ABFC24_10565 [Methanoregulaceae archaeon]